MIVSLHRESAKRSSTALVNILYNSWALSWALWSGGPQEMFFSSSFSSGHWSQLIGADPGPPTWHVMDIKRMETEAKAKVVASVFCFWGTIYWIPYRDRCFASVDLKEKDEFNFFVQIDRGKTANQELNTFCPQTEATTFAFASVSILLLCMDMNPWVLISVKF